jgi:AraC-like DNA-binding protein
MTAPRLDRLSALLEGLAPRVWLTEATLGFALHILVHTPHDDAPVDVSAMALLVCPPHTSADELAQAQRKGQTRWMSFEVALDGPVAPIFLSDFVAPLQIDLGSADASLAQIVHLIAGEMSVTRCGQPLLMNRAGDILLIGLLRHLVAQPQKTTGLFTALANPRIAKTLVAMHADASKPWSLKALADEAGMSRTTFVNQFKLLMQVSPGKYLENLRLALAQRLVTNGMGLKQAAHKTGYASASTLSRAMSRTAL